MGFGGRGGAVVKALRYKPEGRGFDSYDTSFSVLLVVLYCNKVSRLAETKIKKKIPNGVGFFH
jgi:hypothetical protein